MAVDIKYKGEIIATAESGQTAALKCSGYKMVGDVEVTAYGSDINADELNEVVNAAVSDALQEAKDSGMFDGSFYVTFIYDTEGSAHTADKTPAEIWSAYQSGQTVVATFKTSDGTQVGASVVFPRGDNMLIAEVSNTSHLYRAIVLSGGMMISRTSIAHAALTINGQTYDGSEAVEINIEKGDKGDEGPAGAYVGAEAPTDGQTLWIDTDEEPDEVEEDHTPIDVVASVGQVIAVKAVDEDSKPTEYKAVDLPKIKTPDFAANEGEDGYIENRTHYVDAAGVVHKLDNKFIDADWMATNEYRKNTDLVIPEQAVSGSFWYNLQQKLLPGIIYDVYLNDICYPCVCYNHDDGGVYLGNGSLSGSTSVPHNNEPFCIFCPYEYAQQGVFYKNTSLSYPLNLKVLGHSYTVYNQLPEEYLPDCVVKSVNGISPNEEGNVEIKAGVDSEDLSTAVEAALAEAKASGEFDGKDGNDGYSPTVSVSKSGKVTTVTITDKNGTKTATINDGTNGTNGTNGVSATHAWNGTTLTVTSASGTSSADLKGAKGDKGDQGEKGADGSAGAKGDKGDKGDAGKTAYAYAKDGGYTGTEAEFANELAKTPLIGRGNGANKITPSQVAEAVAEGRAVAITYPISGVDCTFSSFDIRDNLVAGELLMGMYDEIDEVNVILLEGSIDTNVWSIVVTGTLAKKDDIPTMLKNPHKLTINGTAYDGSEAVTLNIEGGSDAEWTATSEHVGNNNIVIAEQTLSSGVWSKLQTKLVVGMTYEVSIDDACYLCVCYNHDDGGIYLGNGTLAGSNSTPHNNEPFCIFAYSDSSTSGTFTRSNALSYPLKLKVTGPIYVEYNKLPEKFLPECVVKSVNGKTPDENGNVSISTGGGGGTSIDVTAEVGQTIVVEEVDGSGKPTKWRAAEYQPRTHWSEDGKVQVLLFQKYRSRLNSEYGFYTFVMCFNEYVESLPLSSISSIVYDGVEYTELAPVDIQGSRFFGNLYYLNTLYGTSFGNSGEPFLLTGDSTGMMMFTLDQKETIHSVQIYANGTEHHRIDQCFAPQIPVVDLTPYYTTISFNSPTILTGDDLYEKVYKVLNNNHIVRLVYWLSSGSIFSVCAFPQRSSTSTIFVRTMADVGCNLSVEANVASVKIAQLT